MTPFYVYYLLCPESGSILYIGRSHNPQARHKAFERRTGVRTELGSCQRHSTFERAQEAERLAIERHRPLHNKKVMSARGMFGHTHDEATKRAIGDKHRGKTMTEESRAKLRASIQGRTSAFKGRRHSDESKALLRQRATGRAHTEESRKKMSEQRKGKPSPIKGHTLGPQKNPRGSHA